MMGEILIFLSQMEEDSSLVPTPSFSVSPRYGNLSINGISFVYQALTLLRNFVVLLKLYFCAIMRKFPKKTCFRKSFKQYK